MQHHLARIAAALSFLLLATVARSQEIPPLDAQGIQMPITDSNFAAVRGPSTPGTWSVKARTSYIDRPLRLNLASPSASGTNSSTIEGSTILELAARSSLPLGFDVGLGWGVHVYQWGEGLDPVTGQSGGLPTFGFRDPRLELGWSLPNSTITLRCFVTGQFPFGTQKAFAGEEKTRGELGIQIGYDWGRVVWAMELGAIARKSVELGPMRWGSQVRWSSGLQYEVFDDFFLGPEVVLAPVVGAQPVSGTRVFPAEALGTAHWKRPHWTLKISGGSGLALSRFDSAQEASQATRGPTSPAVRALVEWTWSMNWRDLHTRQEETQSGRR